MPLTLTPATLSAAATLTGLRALASAYESATRQLDGILDGIIALPDADLAELGNAMGAEQMEQLLAAHAAQVAGVNQLSAATQQIIAALENREPAAPRLASTASLTERLAAQNREIIAADGVFSVVTHPAPQPPEDPQP